MRINKVVKLVKNNEVFIKYSSLRDASSLVIEWYSDISHGNLTDGGSQGGYLIFVDDSNVSNMFSKQSQRKSNSSEVDPDSRSTGERLPRAHGGQAVERAATFSQMLCVQKVAGVCSVLH